MNTNQIPDSALDAHLDKPYSDIRNALRAAVVALAPASSTPLTDARIREICLSHGYELKPDDLKDYVYAAARQIAAEAAAQAQQERDTARALVDNHVAEIELLAVNLAGERQLCAAITAERDTLRANCKMWMERSGRQADEIERLKASRE